MEEMLLMTLLSFLAVQYASTYSYADVTRLNKDLLENYDPRVRGNSNMSEKTNITITSFVTSLVEFEELTGKFSFVAYFVIQWRDERMRWNVSKYNGVRMTSFYQSDVWYPLITPSRSCDEMKRLGFEWLFVGYNFRGQASWIPGDLYEAKCHPDITMYPFDVQECDVEFLVMAGTTGTIYLHSYPDHIMLDLFTNHAVWELQKTKTYVSVQDPGIIKYHLVFTLKRESGFYIIGLILPIATLGILNLMVFALPAESGERVGYSITVLLALAVFLTIASESLPKTSKPSIPLLCVKLFIDMVISCSIMLYTVIGLRMYHTDDAVPVPKCFASLTRCCCNRKKKSYDDNKAENDTDIDVYVLRNNNSRKKKTSTEEQTHGTEERVTWKEVGRRFDVIFFLLSCAEFTISHGLMLALVYLN